MVANVSTPILPLTTPVSGPANAVYQAPAPQGAYSQALPLANITSNTALTGAALNEATLNPNFPQFWPQATDEALHKANAVKYDVFRENPILRLGGFFNELAVAFKNIPAFEKLIGPLWFAEYVDLGTDTVTQFVEGVKSASVFNQHKPNHEKAVNPYLEGTKRAGAAGIFHLAGTVAIPTLILEGNNHVWGEAIEHSAWWLPKLIQEPIKNSKFLKQAVPFVSCVALIGFMMKCMDPIFESWQEKLLELTNSLAVREPETPPAKAPVVSPMVQSVSQANHQGLAQPALPPVYA